MEAKQLAIQSFERNQGLMESVNKLLIHLKLSAKGVDDQLPPKELADARTLITAFLTKLSSLVGSIEKTADPLTGIDLRYRSLVRKYVDAKSRRQQFKSALFRNSPQKVLELMTSEKPEDHVKLIDSLTEFRALLEDHGQADVRELMGGL
jgi:hypothetical protein